MKLWTFLLQISLVQTSFSMNVESVKQRINQRVRRENTVIDAFYLENGHYIVDYHYIDKDKTIYSSFELSETELEDLFL